MNRKIFTLVYAVFDLKNNHEVFFFCFFLSQWVISMVQSVGFMKLLVAIESMAWQEKWENKCAILTVW